MSRGSKVHRHLLYPAATAHGLEEAGLQAGTRGTDIITCAACLLGPRTVKRFVKESTTNDVAGQLNAETLLTFVWPTIRSMGWLLRHQALLPRFSPITADVVRHTVNKSTDSFLLAPVHLATLLRSAVRRTFIPAHPWPSSRLERDVEDPSARGGQTLRHCQQETVWSLRGCTDLGPALCNGQVSAVLFTAQWCPMPCLVSQRL